MEVGWEVGSSWIEATFILVELNRTQDSEILQAQGRALVQDCCYPLSGELT